MDKKKKTKKKKKDKQKKKKKHKKKIDFLKQPKKIKITATIN